jgi:hypothetical protein
LAVLHVSVTVFPAGRPVPDTVTVEPGIAVSGTVFRTCIVCAGVPGSTIGPGSALPGTAGAATGPTVPEAERGARRTITALPAIAASVVRVKVGMAVVLSPARG